MTKAKNVRSSKSVKMQWKENQSLNKHLLTNTLLIDHKVIKVHIASTALIYTFFMRKSAIPESLWWENINILNFEYINACSSDFIYIISCDLHLTKELVKWIGPALFLYA